MLGLCSSGRINLNALIEEIPCTSYICFIIYEHSIVYELNLFIVFDARNYGTNSIMQDPTFTQPERQSFIGLYSSPEGIRAIDGQVKIRILGMLAEQEMAFDELVSRSGRAKSTVSVHLKDLADTGIIGARQDPHDARKKIFYLNSLYLAGADAGLSEWFDVKRYIRKDIPCSGDPATMYRFLLSSIRLTLLNKGIIIDPVLHIAGLAAGQSLYPCVRAGTLDHLVANVQKIWQKNSLGAIEVEVREPLTIRIRDCFECSDFPISGRPACSFEAGIFSSIFSSHFGRQAKIVETHCYAMGNNFCRFEILGSSGPGSS
jgi:predicted hydrocarbon binding protein/DNA-binding MarR family transcriptional regulator